MRTTRLATRFRYETKDARIRDRVTPADTPHLFEIASATRALAYLAAVGPVSRDMLVRLRPGIPVQRTCAVLDRYAEAGLLCAFHAPALANNPRIWGLNRRHTSAHAFRNLCLALWTHAVERHFVEQPTSPFQVPEAETRVASGGPAIYRREGFRDLGRILHLLAQTEGPVLQSVARRLIDAPEKFENRVSLLVAYGLVEERHEHCDRHLWLNLQHPLGRPLRTWLRHLNRVSFPEFRAYAAEYRTRRRAGDYTWASRVRAGHRRSGRLSS